MDFLIKHYETKAGTDVLKTCVHKVNSSANCETISETPGSFAAAGVYNREYINEAMEHSDVWAVPE